MKRVSDYFDEAKKITGSDYKTAQRIGLTRQGVSKARKGDGMSNRVCRDLAALIGVNPIEIIAAAEAQKHPEEAEKWKQWVAAAAIMAAILTGGFSISSETYAANLIENNYTLCAVKSGASMVEITELPG